MTYNAIRKLMAVLLAALALLSPGILGAPGASAAPLPACTVKATASSQLTGFLIFEGYRGIGYGDLTCSEPVTASFIGVNVEVTPAGEDAGATPCTNSYSCEADADASTARAPVNCTFVEAAGMGFGAPGVPADAASDCNTTNP